MDEAALRAIEANLTINDEELKRANIRVKSLKEEREDLLLQIRAEIKRDDKQGALFNTDGSPTAEGGPVPPPPNELEVDAEKQVPENPVDEGALESDTTQS